MAKIEIIEDNCISCGMCINQAPATFAWNDEGKSKVIDQTITEEIKNIAGTCPTGAIVITEN